MIARTSATTTTATTIHTHEGIPFFSASGTPPYTPEEFHWTGPDGIFRGGGTAAAGLAACGAVGLTACCGGWLAPCGVRYFDRSAEDSARWILSGDCIP